MDSRIDTDSCFPDFKAHEQDFAGYTEPNITKINWKTWQIGRNIDGALTNIQKVFGSTYIFCSLFLHQKWYRQFIRYLLFFYPLLCIHFLFMFLLELCHLRFVSHSYIRLSFLSTTCILFCFILSNNNNIIINFIRHRQ